MRRARAVLAFRSVMSDDLAGVPIAKQKSRRSSTSSSQLAPAATSQGAAAAARNATLTQLVDESARSDAHATVLCGEMHDVERDVSWLAEALQSTQDTLNVAERSAQQHYQNAEAERETAERMRQELRARQEEQEALLSRLAAARQELDLQQERVRSVSSEFEATASDWQAQLAAADGKWRAMVDALRQRLGLSEAQTASDASKLQQMSLDCDALAARLRAAQEDAAEQLRAARTAQSSESELLVSAGTCT